MPDKTHSELIRELRDMVIALVEGERNLHRDLDRHDAALNRLTESLAALSNRTSVLERDVAELQKRAEESGRRWWALLPSLLGAIIGSILTILGQLLLSDLRK